MAIDKAKLDELLESVVVSVDESEHSTLLEFVQVNVEVTVEDVMLILQLEINESIYIDQCEVKRIS